MSDITDTVQAPLFNEDLFCAYHTDASVYTDMSDILTSTNISV